MNECVNRTYDGAGNSRNGGKLVFDVSVVGPVDDPEGGCKGEHHQREKGQKRHHVNQQTNYRHLRSQTPH